MPKKEEYWKKKYSKYFNSNLNSLSERLKSKWFKFKYRKCFLKAEAHFQVNKNTDKELEKLFIKHAKIYINEEEIPILTVEERAYQILNECTIKVNEKWKRIWKFLKWFIPIILTIFTILLTFLLTTNGGRNN